MAFALYNVPTLRGMVAKLGMYSQLVAFLLGNDLAAAAAAAAPLVAWCWWKQSTKQCMNIKIVV